MNEDTSIVRLRQPEEIDDPLTALLRSGARQLLEQAIEAEVAAFLAAGKDLKLADGRDRLVRHDGWHRHSWHHVAGNAAVELDSGSYLSRQRRRPPRVGAGTRYPEPTQRPRWKDCKA